MSRKNPHKPVLLGARVDPSIVKEIDAIVAAYARRHPASPWSRSDALRELLTAGIKPLRARVDAMATEGGE